VAVPQMRKKGGGFCTLAATACIFLVVSSASYDHLPRSLEPTRQGSSVHLAYNDSSNLFIKAQKVSAVARCWQAAWPR
jgi:hypothetical protein